jgi:hypothetical protein
MSFTISLRRLPALAGAIGTLAASLSGCGGGNSAVTQQVNNRSACAANTPHADGRARWTVLIYMNSANNLLPDSFTNIAQMASVGSDSNVNIVVQWKQTVASQINNPFGNDSPSFVGTHRYLIHKHLPADLAAINNHDTSSLETTDRLADPSTNSLDAVTGAQTSDMGNINTLTNFIQWGTAAYPADNLAVLIWNHGSGWRPVYNTVSGQSVHPLHTLPTINVPGRRAFSQDDNTRNEIQTWQMPAAFAGITTPIDVLVFDASLEQMIEVAYQDRNLARVQVGSEESPPGSGYPYDKWLTDLKNSGKNPCDLAGSIVQEFVAAYSGQTGITQSYLDMSKMDGVRAALEAFGVALLPHVNDQAAIIAAARNNAVHYGEGASLYEGFIDLYGFADNIATTTTQTDIKTAANNLKAALVGTSGAILQNGTGSSDEANSHGLSVYIPSPGNYLSAYSNLSLATDAPHWRLFIQSQTQ